MTEPRMIEGYFADICIEKCAGKCCSPWWGIVSYTLKKEGGLSRLSEFGKTLLASVREREERIVSNYITTEDPPRRLFDKPERYNLAVEKIDVSGATLLITLRAMFAFNCKFFTEDGRCAIHPAVIGSGDIRPPHCGYMGSPGARYGEKGFCRVIHAAETYDKAAVERALEEEAASSRTHYNEGFLAIEPAVEKTLAYINEYCRTSAPHLFPQKSEAQKPGRNDPCPCGSGKKYKKCHSHYRGG